jgi:radical SAM protein with 4Fe4S-binding SPASM domain
VREDAQALAFLEDWIGFSQALEARYGLAPRAHDWERIRAAHFLDQDENASRYTLLPGVQLVWKRCHTWGNVIGGHATGEVASTYCPAPYDQFVIQWNGDVATCCTDYEGRTKVANVFAESVEAVWKGAVLKKRKRDMLSGRLLEVCAKCQSLG